MPTAPTFRKDKQPQTVAAGAADPEGGVCAHCGDSLAGLRRVERSFGRGTQSYCCLGCAFIAEQLYLSQASDADRVALEAQLVQGPGQRTQPSGSRAQIDVRGMVCGACALLIESRLRAAPGVLQAHVDFAGQRAYVNYNPAATDRERLVALIERTGYRTDDDAQRMRRAGRIELLRVLLAWLAMMQVMMLAVPAYLAAPGDIPSDIAQLLRIAQAMLTVPVVVFCAAPILRAARNQLLTASIGMDLPIVLGLGAAFAASLWATVRAEGPVYFDSITMFVALVLGVRWLQSRALAVARGHLDSVQRRSVLMARRLRAYPGSNAADTVRAEELAAGDHVQVPVGETIAADGVIEQGATRVSQAWLTGEATPLERKSGSPVLAGAVNLEQPIIVRVTRAGEATSLAALRRLVDAAGGARPRVVEMANRVAVFFLWAVVLITAATVFGWWMVDPVQALPSAIAVLVATCPCALSLAAPTALAATQAALAERGVLTTRVAALERLERVRVLAVDKTGTLTEPAPMLTRVATLREINANQVLAWAAALESVALHPFARALVQSAADANLTLPPVEHPHHEPSQGVEGTIDGRRMRIGQIEYALALAGPVSQHAWFERWPAVAARLRRDDSVVALADREGALALFAFGEVPRHDAIELVRVAKALGIEVLLVSGDRNGPVERLARSLEIERSYAQQTPASKRELIADLQLSGANVAMLGDGFNDAPVLAQADVSIAMADGAALAQARADFIVVESRPGDVAALLRASRRGMRIVRSNFGWALAYNVGVIPLAALGYLTPALAAVGMAASSVLVVLNALRARRID